MNKVLSIILVTSEFPPGPGGIGNHAFNLYRYLEARGHKVLVVTEHRAQFGPKLYSPSLLYLKRKLGHSFRFILLVYRQLKRRDPDVIILSGTKSLIAGLSAFFFKAKVLSVIHGHEMNMGSIWKNFLVKIIINRSDEVVAVSKFSSLRIQSVVNRDVHVIPNGVAVESLSKEAEPKKWNTESLKLITVGTLSKRKGQHNVIAALPLIKNNFPDCEYHMIGHQEDIDRLKADAAELNVINHLVFHGVVSEEEKIKLIKSCHIVILLSENLPNGDVEGFGISILEGNYFGLPAIGSQGTGIEEAISDGHSGILVDPHSSDMVADAVRKIRNNYQSFSENSAKWAKAHNWENQLIEYEKLLVS